MVELRILRGIKSRYLQRASLAVLVLPIIFASCYSSRGVNYLQSNVNTMQLSVSPTEYLVQPNDVLNIKVQSRDPEQSTFFNISTVENRNIQANPASFFVTGYSVKPDGTIDLAIVGNVDVGGLTVEQIRDKIQVEIDKYLVNAMVLVKLTSFKISVLGDVKNPGTNYVFNTQSTIFEALSAAGDLNISGNRKNVKLIRQIGDKSMIQNLDLTDPTIVRSPYYFLHPNDVIYVEPSRQAVARENLSIFSIVLSAISTTVLVLSFIQN